VSSNVTAVISTKNRYFSTLPHVLMGIINQTVQPDRVIIYDDSDEVKDLRKEDFYKNIFSILGSRWELTFGAKKGQVLNHQKSLEDSKTDYIWRLDDDNIPEANVLEVLLKNMTDGMGAVGGLVIDPKTNFYSHPLASNKIEDIYLGLNVQWFKDTKKQEVDHLYSSFLYRREAAKQVGGYCTELSPVGHREETILTYSMKKAGWKLIVDPMALTWHFRESTGGIRSYENNWLWEHDEKIFSRKIQEWEIKLNNLKLVVLDAGLGDHLVFKKILPEVLSKYEKVAFAVCYPEVFEDDNITLLSINQAKMMLNIDDLNIYKFCIDHQWTKSLEEAYRELYL